MSSDRSWPVWDGVIEDDNIIARVRKHPSIGNIFTIINLFNVSTAVLLLLYYFER